MPYSVFNYDENMQTLWELTEEMNERFTGFDLTDGDKVALLLPSVIEVWKASHGL